MATAPGSTRPLPNQYELSALLHHLYSSVTDPRELNAFIGQCSQHIGAVSAAVAISEIETGRWRYFDFYPGPVDLARVYETHYAEEDPVKSALLRLPPRRFYFSHELCDEHTQRTHPYWVEWFAKLDYTRRLRGAHTSGCALQLSHRLCAPNRGGTLRPPRAGFPRPAAAAPGTGPADARAHGPAEGHGRPGAGAPGPDRRRLRGPQRRRPRHLSQPHRTGSAARSAR